MTNAETTIHMGETAIWYASGGWRVFPVAPRGKRPLTAHGFQDATTDPATIAVWWQQWPDANIGLACGPSGLIALDADPAHFTDESRAFLADLLADHPTTAQTTPSGGTHLLYRLPADASLTNSPRGLPPGFDVRVGGYVLLAPSLVEYRGEDAGAKNVPDGHSGRYAWSNGRDPYHCYPRPLPDHVLDLLRPPQRQTPIYTNGQAVARGLQQHGPARPGYGAAALEKELDILARTPEGNRNEQLNKSAYNLGQLVAGGELMEAEVIEKLTDVAAAIGLDETETRKAISSGLAAGMKQPRSAPPRTPLGFDAAAMAVVGGTPQNNGPTDDTGGTDDTSPPAGGTSPKGDVTRKPSQAEILYSLASTYTEAIFTAQDGTAYAFVPVAGRRECYRLTDANFSGWLTALYRTMCGGAMPGADGRSEVIAALAYDARTTRRDVFVRVGGHDGRVFIDLGTPEWDAIVVDEDGWQIVKTPALAFRRPASMRPLPTPLHGYDMGHLRRFLNLESEQWPLVAAWLIAAAGPSGPYPILAFTGEQGSAKSAMVRVLKEILDPSAAGLRGQPEEVRDLWVGANNSWVLAYDNVSHLNNDVSDALCRLATGGGYAKRANYTDDGEFVMDAQRPVVINGIGDVVTRPDLMDRTILIAPPVIPEDRRRNEKEFWAEFEQARPFLLGALLDGLSVALARIGTVSLPTLPRMADFAMLAAAAEPAYRADVGFLEAYAENREEAHATVVESSTLGEHLRKLVLVNGAWEGTASELLAALNERASDSEQRAHVWPKAPNKVKPALQRLAPSLRHIGVDVEFTPRNTPNGGRRIRLVRLRT